MLGKLTNRNSINWAGRAVSVGKVLAVQYEGLSPAAMPESWAQWHMLCNPSARERETGRFPRLAASPSSHISKPKAIREAV